MGFRDIFKILILFIILIIFFIWIVYYLYSIKLANRIKNTTVKSTNINKESLFDSIYNWYLKEKDKIANKLINNKQDNRERKRIIYTSIDSITCSICIVIIYLFLSLFYLSVPNIDLIFISWVIGLFIPSVVSTTKQRITKKQIEKNLLKVITLINNGLSSGKSIRESIESTKDKLDGPIKEEIEEVLNDLNHGLSLEVAFSRMQKRTNVKDIIYLTTTLSMLSKTGGNTLHMFNYLEKIFTTRNKLDQELNSTIASSKLVFIIMSIIPIVVFIGMMFIYPNFLVLFVSSTLGELLGLIILLLYTLYVIIIRRIMIIEKY